VGLVEHRRDRHRAGEAAALGDDENGLRPLGVGEGLALAKLGPVVKRVTLFGLNLGIPPGAARWPSRPRPDLPWRSVETR
jgi:hypothetical protein